ncbi:hypothetical protein SBRCBS47491_005074 [Sporothrix bragantina]|uniref:GAT domain-containing protein n=1 Tax=Sporothrix bragantina TaxID=671064 RepID=A0ABP0BTR7_9PEZI
MKGFRQKLNRNKRATFDAETALPQRPGSIAATTGTATGPGSIAGGDNVDLETPEAAAQRLVRTFCMSEVDEAGAEVALLPSIVEAAESSPQAAAECARYIRKFMYKDYWSRPNFVYNAIMLMRILVENPGLTFTRNFDKKFVDTVRDLLRGCQHAHIVHFLIETLQDLESKGAVDDGIGRLVEMWQKEKAKSKSAYSNQPQQQQGSQGGRGGLWQRPQPPMWSGQGQNSGPSSYSNGQGYADPGGFVGPGYNLSRGPYERGHSSAATLPKPSELRRRLREAKTTASVLADVVNTTTPAALLKHDLADDLSARCRRATNQVLEYLNTRDPIPDNNEMADLLATHEVLEQTLHHYHRAVLEARKSLGVGESRRPADGHVPAEMTPAGKGKANAPASPTVAGPSGTNNGGTSENNTGYINGPESPRSGDEAFDRNEDDDMIAAAIAASTAPGANARPGRSGYEAGGSSSAANEIDNPFADNLPESSRSSSRVRPSYGGGSGSGGGGGSSSAAGGAGGSSSAVAGVAYVDSENESDEEYLRVRRRNKATAEAGGSSSSAAAGASGSSRAPYAAGGSSSAAAGASSSSSSAPPPIPPAFTKPGPASPRSTAPGSPTGFDAGVGGSSSSAGPAVDAEAQGSGAPVFRY